MAQVPIQTGRTSAFAWAKQSAQGTQGTAGSAGRIDNLTMDAMDNPNVVIFETINGTLDAQNQARVGVHEVSAKVTYPGFLNQGAGLMKAGLGQDVQQAAFTNCGVLTGGPYSVGATAFTVTTPPSTPTGVGQWNGVWAQIGTGAGADYSPIVKVVGSVVTVLGEFVKLAHPLTDTLTIQKQHMLVPNTGGNRTTLDFISVWAQYGAMFERQLIDCYVDSFGLKGDNEKLTVELSLASSAPIQAETATLSTLTYQTAEANDVPAIQRDGGIFTFKTSADTVPTVHGRLVNLQYTLAYALQKEKVGGGQQLAVLQAVAKRTQKVVFTELAGYDGSLSAIHAQFIGNAAAADNETPVFIAFWIAKSNQGICIYCPRGRFNKFDPIGPSDRPIEWTGEITMLNDPAVTGIPYLVSIVNGQASSY